jgi:hypothetical protein
MSLIRHASSANLVHLNSNNQLEHHEPRQLSIQPAYSFPAAPLSNEFCIGILAIRTIQYVRIGEISSQRRFVSAYVR